MRPTREGWVFLSTLLAVALAALNTGNNLLYLVLASMLALVAVSSVLSEWSIRGLRVSRSLEQEAFAGEPVRGRWQVRNTRPLAVALDIHLEEVASRHASLATSAGADLAELSAGGRSVVPASWCFRQRGIHRIEAVRISTAWPFGIFRKWYEQEAQMDVLVFPGRLGGLGRRAPRPVGVGTVEHEHDAVRPSGRGDFVGLREHRPGDDPRMIHWRSSARRGRLLSAERSEDGSSGLVELSVDAPPDGEIRERSRQFEERIQQATARLWELVEEGMEVRITLLGVHLPIARDAASRRGVLRSLALVELPTAGL